MKINGLELLVSDSTFSGLLKSLDESGGGDEIVAVCAVDNDVGLRGEGGEKGGVREGSCR